MVLVFVLVFFFFDCLSFIVVVRLVLCLVVRLVFVLCVSCLCPVSLALMLPCRSCQSSHMCLSPYLTLLHVFPHCAATNGSAKSLSTRCPMSIYQSVTNSVYCVSGRSCNLFFAPVRRWLTQGKSYCTRRKRFILSRCLLP